MKLTIAQTFDAARGKRPTEYLTDPVYVEATNLLNGDMASLAVEQRNWKQDAMNRAATVFGVSWDSVTVRRVYPV